jgi:hypothetical protein
VKKPRRSSSLLRELLRELGAGELARRTGYSEGTLKRAGREGKLSEGVQDAVRGSYERREAAKRGAETRELGKSRIPEKLARDIPLPELARKLDRSEKTVKRWVERGGAPPAVLDAARELAAGRARVYPLDWEHGETRALPAEDRERLSRTLRDFLEAKRTGNHEDIASAFRAWRRAKVPIRRRLSRAAWEELVDDLGAELDLPDVGTFSKERFKKS